MFSWTELAHRPEPAHRQPIGSLTTTTHGCCSPMKSQLYLQHKSFPVKLKRYPASIIQRPQGLHLFNPCNTTSKVRAILFLPNFILVLSSSLSIPSQRDKIFRDIFNLTVNFMKANTSLKHAVSWDQENMFNN